MGWLLLASAAVGSLATIGCSGAAGVGDTYCQSGPRYGTECYSGVDVRSPPGRQGPPEMGPDPEEGR